MKAHQKTELREHEQQERAPHQERAAKERVARVKQRAARVRRSLRHIEQGAARETAPRKRREGLAKEHRDKEQHEKEQVAARDSAGIYSWEQPQKAASPMTRAENKSAASEDWSLAEPESELWSCLPKGLQRSILEAADPHFEKCKSVCKAWRNERLKGVERVTIDSRFGDHVLLSFIPFSHYPNIRSLDVSEYLFDVTEADLVWIDGRCASLEEIRFGTKRVPPIALRGLFSSCPKLTVLSCCADEIEEVRQLAEYTALTSLTLNASVDHFSIPLYLTALTGLEEFHVNSSGLDTCFPPTVCHIPEQLFTTDSRLCALSACSEEHCVAFSLPDSLTCLLHLTSLKVPGLVTTTLLDLSLLGNSLVDLSISQDCSVACLRDLTFLTRLEVEIELEGSLLQQLPDALCGYTRLRDLRLSAPSLNSLPQGFGQLGQLQRLPLRCTSLVELPDSFRQLECLEHLEFEAGMWDLPDILRQLTRLTLLDINLPSRLYDPHHDMRVSRGPLWLQRLSDAPAGTRHLQALRSLRVHNLSDFTSLPESLGQLGNLTYLVLDKGGQITHLPGAMGQLSNLQQLELSGLSLLNGLPVSFGDLGKLEVLIFKDVEIRGNFRLEPLGRLSSLTSLCFERCMILNTLPDSLASLPQMLKLQVDSCSFSRIQPSSLSSLVSLQELSLKWAPFTGLAPLPEAIGCLTSLTSLHMHGEIRSLPEAIRELLSLRQLAIDGIIATVLPRALGCLSSLTSLEISNCPALASLPEYIRQLKSLVKLKVDNCPALREVPDGLGSLTALGSFVLRQLQLDGLPESLFQLPHLTSLVLEGSFSADVISESLGDLTSLRSLTMNRLKITALPESLGNLARLGKLEIRVCRSLKRFPVSFTRLSALQLMILDECRSLEGEAFKDGKLPGSCRLYISNCGCRLRRRLPRGLRNVEFGYDINDGFYKS